MVKRLMVAAAFMLLVLSAGARVARAHEKSEQTVIKSRDFTIPKAGRQCSQLPVGLVVKGLGLERTTTVVKSADEGDKHESDEAEVGISYSLLSRITGTATDNFGGTYTFSYQFALEKPVTLPGVGIVIDTFKLTGTGAADGLSTFLKGKATFDSAANPTFEILEQSGQPFGCDPL
jgi:hypothetical protein